MRWFRHTQAARGPRPDAPAPAETLQARLVVTKALTAATVAELVERIDRLPEGASVVVDVTAVPAFDTDGVSDLLDLQAGSGQRSVAMVGLSQAADRLLAAVEVPDPRLAVADPVRWHTTALHHVSVVRAETGPDGSTTGPIDPALLRATLDEAVESCGGMVVLDLIGVPRLGATAAQVVAETSGAASLRSVELVVVNVSAAVSAELTRQRLSVSTFVAPPPPDLDPMP